ncbi:MAG TPA: DNA-formamidopyrimidine glycosylase family protein [Solirubrobacteraceae bacterium]|jgi:endonuclease-8|nr:DNA-formamidopyrimidine glycosylase family protein [Solirubrobacteraceae bacterium]
MPEGDTIHRAAERIRTALGGRTMERVETPQARHRHDGWSERLTGCELRVVDAHGKHLFLRFAGGWTLHSHLRMSGSWGVGREGMASRRPRGRAWLILAAGGWEAIQYGGPVLELMRDTRARTDPRLAGLGPDVIGKDFDQAVFLRRLREDDPTRPIGDALLDQHTIAGIGNMWKAESFFAAGVDPWRPTADVTDEQALAVVGFARERMARSVREGNEARPHAVYRQAGRPCPRCGTKIRQRGQWEHNRVTFWCPNCQS